MSGTLASAAAFASIAVWHDATWQLFAATTFQGIGTGLVFSSLAGAVIAAVPPDQTGVASGMNANIRTIGGSVGSAVMAGVVTARLGPTARARRERIRDRLRRARRRDGVGRRGRRLHAGHP